MPPDFPVHDYLIGHIVDGVTLSRDEHWWRAALLIKHPATNRKYVKLYSWQRVGDRWSAKHQFKITTQELASDVLDALGKFASEIAQ